MICEACRRSSHGDCSGQVLMANMPCDCKVCWGGDGSIKVHERMLKAIIKSRPGPSPMVSVLNDLD